jgi:hypothetical protein
VRGVAASTGTAVALAVSNSIALMNAQASASAIALAVSNAIALMVGSAAGQAVAQGFAQGSATAVGSASGASLAQALGRSALTAVGSSQGSATVLGYWQKSGYIDISVDIDITYAAGVDVSFANFGGVRIYLAYLTSGVLVDLPAQDILLTTADGHRTYLLATPVSDFVLEYSPTALKLDPASQL